MQGVARISNSGGIVFFPARIAKARRGVGIEK